MIGYIDCYCDGYLAAAAAGGFCSLALVILAFLSGAWAKSRRKLALALVAVWLTIQSVSFYLGYRTIYTMLDMLPEEKRAEAMPGLAEWADHYIQGMAGQFIFNAVVLFVLPAMLAHILFRSRQQAPLSSNE